MISVAKIYLLTGENQTGKTNLCLDVIKLAKQMGIQLGGVISPGVFQQGEKTAIDLLDIRSGERLRLADGIAAGKTKISTQRWAFKTYAVNRGNQILQNAIPCDLLVIDELGPLEFWRGEGWVNGFKVVASGSYKAALLVIRPSLVDEAFKRWDIDRIINLDEPGNLHPSAEEIIQSLFPNR